MRKAVVTQASIAVLVGFALAGCAHPQTLEEAQAACAKKGGLLMIIEKQKLTMAGPGPLEKIPGDCLSPSTYDKPAAPPPAPAN